MCRSSSISICKTLQFLDDVSQFYGLAPGSAHLALASWDCLEIEREAWREERGVRSSGHSAHCQLPTRSETVDSNDTMAAFHRCFNILDIPSTGTAELFLSWQFLVSSWPGRVWLAHAEMRGQEIILARLTRKRRCIIVGRNLGYISFSTWRIYINYAGKMLTQKILHIMMTNSIDAIFLLQPLLPPAG